MGLQNTLLNTYKGIYLTGWGYNILHHTPKTEVGLRIIAIIRNILNKQDIMLE